MSLKMPYLGKGESMQILQWHESNGVEKLVEMDGFGELDHIVIKGLPIDLYHSPLCPGVSSSAIVGIKKSLIHYELERERGFDKPALKFGNFFHTSVLEPHLLDKIYAQDIEEPKFDKRTTVGKADYAKWVQDVQIPHSQQVAGKTVFSAAEYDRCKKMTESALAHPEFARFLKSSINELSFFSRCPKTKMLQKCRVDVFVPEVLIAIDLKSTVDASASGFPKQCMNYDYIVKQAYYDMIISRFFDAQVNYLLMATENPEPHESHLFEIAPADIEAGGEYVKQLIEKYNGMISGKERKGYPRGIQPLKMPAYFYNTDKYEA
jgi:exodeoxyribonuclease VIII